MYTKYFYKATGYMKKINKLKKNICIYIYSMCVL